MEIIGLILGFLLFGCVGVALCVVFAFIPNLRRFVLPAAIVPASSYFLLITLGWLVLDHSPVCGPDPEWDRCPSHIVHIAMMFVWLLGTACAFMAAVFLQKVLVLSWQNFIYRKQSLSIIQK